MQSIDLVTLFLILLSPFVVWLGAWIGGHLGAWAYRVWHRGHH